MSESVPTSVNTFSHRRSRADSTASFAYYPDEEEVQQWSDDEAIVDDEAMGDFEDGAEDLEAGDSHSLYRVSTGHSRSSVHDRLLRSDSVRTENSGLGKGERVSQKIYIVTQDLTIVVAGFRSTTIGLALYTLICVLTAGLGFLIFRWLPRWQVRIVGTPCPLRDCTWVVIENQWGEFVVQDMDRKEYCRSLSTVFGVVEKQYLRYDEDDDPILDDLVQLDYRYMRFSFHPLKDKLLLTNSWKDPAWTDVRTIRAGIDAEEKENRELVFGQNIIGIQQKSIPQLLMDEVT
jgi:cation-transporting ATPase 13A2